MKNKNLCEDLQLNFDYIQNFIFQNYGNTYIYLLGNIHMIQFRNEQIVLSNLINEKLSNDV